MLLLKTMYKFCTRQIHTGLQLLPVSTQLCPCCHGGGTDGTELCRGALEPLCAGLRSESVAGRWDRAGLGCTELQPFPIPGPVEAVQFISEGEAIGLQLPPAQPELELPPAVAGSPVPKGQLARSSLESQPLMRGCAERRATTMTPSDVRSGTAEALAPLSSCASEMQHKWPHTPVECTELDLQKFSSQMEFVSSERSEEAGTRAAPKESGSAALEANSGLSMSPARGMSTAMQSPAMQSPATESRERQVSKHRELFSHSPCLRHERLVLREPGSWELGSLHRGATLVTTTTNLPGVSWHVWERMRMAVCGPGRSPAAAG